MTEHADGEDPSIVVLVSLVEKVERLTAAVQVLAARHRRKRIADAVLAAVVAAVVLLGSLYYFVELPDRRSDLRQQIRGLACYAVRLRPPGYSPTSDALRAKYQCPPYDPSVPGAGATPTPVPSPSSTRRVTPGAAQSPSAASTPRAGASAGLGAAGSQAARTASPRPAASSTRRASTGNASRPPAAATSTGLVQLPSVSLCQLRVVGLGLCSAAG